MKKNKYMLNQVQPAAIALVTFLILLFATVGYTNYKQGQWEKDIRENLLDVLIGKKSKLEKALYSRIYYTRGVAAMVSLNPDISTEEFYNLAEEFVRNDTVISSMALSRDCVINAIYPLKGHESALGLDLLTHPERKEIVEKTINTRHTFVAGPVKLVEGGTAFISYTPIFNKRNLGNNKFWGVTDIVIRQQSLFNEAQFVTPEGNYEFALRGYNGLGEKGAIFWGKKEIFENNPVTISIELPIGTWVLAGIPVNGWTKYPDMAQTISYVLFFSSLVISILIGLFARALLKIKHNERELKAIFGSMDNLIVEYDQNGKYIKIAPTNDSILFRSKKDLLGKTVHEIFDRGKADFFLKAIQECIGTKKVVVIEYLLEIDGQERWFSARINAKTDNTVIFNAWDITERKKDDQIIRQSEIRLKELNDMKDKFFSIIAHDLRNPVSGLKMMTDLILEDYDELGSDQLKDLIETMQASSTNLHLLLEDLLQWSLSQSGKIVVKKQVVPLDRLCAQLIDRLRGDAHLKDISIKYETDSNDFVVADHDLTGVILRNLVANAIKFTNRGGEIKICSRELIIDHQRVRKISVIDNGIGIKPERMDTIFSFDKNSSTPGTENEKGTGLGLLLCKELVEKQGGVISVTSTAGKGSNFSIVLPMEEEKIQMKY